MFLGTYTGKLSPKRRVAMPSSFRKILGENFIVAKWYERCLVIIGRDNWKALLEKLTGKVELITRPVRDTDRFILGSAYEVKPDPQGRFIIPEVLKDYAQLTDEIVFVGLGERIEVWNKHEWHKKEKEVQEQASAMIEELAKDIRKGGKL
ncbi:division/cell wall cluster transcriptional repressor MraZ [Candidatus Woesebacteria bacterium RBG_19FT_COMBO_42_9]|uniref:Transcriptional regulator MraZ n=1 Tax=Candidatus Woesebacteria bacterium RBG_16_42_24 TaxID=1802485 RepID=A0A1F7XKL1_9BACT|nr:MAG: division/cell wall cluster transcriptional repressor MraZ [Candidatus Woesebacteria bacterium RBG_16_42_24]OGM16135.1 MAG: division/cell wall cluster transcriptional repressor MraZ [Candidatus Woesebacteria bacterium RBG_19FT_COMBO_42_9]OGM67839.1 MAG: division/cell wall cluster transcriptional repressor MraZ [Candidatus Woesebacteria bacterium RIFCSPLOWO2_01_FULL_43_11]